MEDVRVVNQGGGVSMKIEYNLRWVMREWQVAEKSFLTYESFGLRHPTVRKEFLL